MAKIKNPRSVSVVIVCESDQERLDATMKRLIRALTITMDEYEILIVNDGSRDQRIPDFVKQLQKDNNRISYFQNVPAAGLARCIQTAAIHATMTFMVYVPGDNSWPYRSFVSLFGNIGKADIITCYSTNLRGGMNFWARQISVAFTKVTNWLFSLQGRYYNGLTVYPVDFITGTRFHAIGFGIQAEALLRAIYGGYTFIQMPLAIDRKHVTPSGSVTVLNTIDALRMLCLTFVDLRLRTRSAAAQDTNGSPTAPIEHAEPKTILLTGGSSGIGAALVRSLAGKGHTVFTCARRLDVLRKVTNPYPNVFAFKCDVAQEAEVTSLKEAVEAKADHIDVIINCAGGFGEIGRIEDTDSKAWMETIQTNLFGTYTVIKTFLPMLQRSTAGRIINFSGGGAFNPFPNYSAYACAKAALVRLTECLAVELSDYNISVNAVAPGFLPTDVHWATVAAGESKAGQVNFNRAVEALRDPEISLDRVIQFVELLVCDFDGLTGKTISVNYDPWSTASFKTHIKDIARSDLYSLRRVDVTNLPQGFLRQRLSEAWSDYGTTN